MITIKRIDGTPIMEVQERDDSKYTRVLMGEHSVRIRFDWNAFIPLPYGSFIEWKGRRFSIWGEYTPVQREGAFEYDIPFEAEERELNNYLFFYLSAGKMEHQWKLTAPIEQALKEVQGNLDRIHGKGAWVISNQVGATPTKLLEFDNTSVFDALTKIAEAYGTEWRAEGRTLFFGRMSEGERVRLSLGNEASRFEPQGDTAQLISRLYAFGSSRNVKSGKRLTLPDDTPFISGTLRGKEAVKIFDDVYPKYNGTISSVSFRSVKEGNIYTIADSALKITQDKLIAGQTLKATFESGALNGLTFDLSITSQGYEIVPNNEYGGRLPSDTLKPAVGDKYVPHGFDIDLVGKEYVPRARTTLKEKAFRWLQENNEDTRDVEVVLNPIAVAERSISITIGKPITLVNALAGGDKVGYITKMEYPLYSPESVTIVVGKAKPLGFIERLKQEGKDEASLIVHELVTPQLNAQQKAVLDVQAMITDAESSATAKTTQALSDAKAYTDGKTNDALEEVARINTALQTELEGKVSALLSNVATIQDNLQRQIDRQVEMYWGEQPPTGRIGWTEADDAKHEGDTYTVRPPEGVTITPQNAKQYPNVGKSWRWHGNGWLEIADTDVTRALALAGEAKASADGKVTHFRGGAIPTGYKQGDLWTLTSVWNGFRQGSILTATQDEVIGQYNPTHWKEEVRYTDDTAIRTLSIGGRNLVRRFDGVKQDGYCLGSWLFTKPEQWQAGLEYTLSFNLGTTHSDPLVWLYVDKYSRVIARIYPQGELKRGDDGLFYGIYIYTFKPEQEDIDRGRPRDGWDGFRLYLGHSSDARNANDPKAKVDKLKLERGNKATDYTEAPEDTADAIKKVDTAVRTLSIGGRNYIRKKYHKEQEGGVLAIDLTETLPAGTYTFSCYAEIKRNKGYIGVLPSLESDFSKFIDSPKSFIGIETGNGESGVYMGVIEIESPMSRIYVYPQRQWAKTADGGLINFRWIKLEKGNKATDYTEAPEDVADASTAKANQALSDAKDFAREEDEKREKALRAEMMQDYLRRVIKDGSTLIKGGLLATNVIALKSTNGKVSSYIDGNEANNIAFAAGVTDAFTADEKRAVEITHDGNARFGQMHLNGKDGVLSFAPIGSAESYLNIGGVARPLDSLLGGTLSSDARTGSVRLDPTATSSDAEITNTKELIGGMNITKDGTTISFSGSYNISVEQEYHENDTSTYPSRPTDTSTLKRANAIGILEIKLIKKGERGDEDKAQILYVSKLGNDTARGSVNFVASATIEKGVYKVVATCTHKGASVGRSSTIATANIATVVTNKSTEVYIGKDSMYAVFGRENFLHVSEDGTTIKGRTDMPGILAAGIARTIGWVDNAFGAKVNRQGYDSAWVERQRDDIYKVYHSIGHSNYSVQVTPINTRDSGCILDVSDYYFTCCFYGTMDINRYQHDFHYLCIGPNTK